MEQPASALGPGGVVRVCVRDGGGTCVVAVVRARWWCAGGSAPEPFNSFAQRGHPAHRWVRPAATTVSSTALDGASLTAARKLGVRGSAAAMGPAETCRHKTGAGEGAAQQRRRRWLRSDRELPALWPGDGEVPHRLAAERAAVPLRRPRADFHVQTLVLKDRRHPTASRSPAGEDGRRTLAALGVAAGARLGQQHAAIGHFQGPTTAGRGRAAKL